MLVAAFLMKFFIFPLTTAQMCSILFGGKRQKDRVGGKQKTVNSKQNTPSRGKINK